MLLRCLIPLLFATTLLAQRPSSDAIEAKRDLPYAGTDNPRQKLDLYLPKKRADEKPLPVIVFIHGGGWQKGDKSGGGRYVAPFVQSGRYAGISVGYRLSGEAQWPAQIHDCKAAIRWIRAQAGTYGLDPERIGVWGASAGGHLVSLLGTSGGVAELEGDLGPHTSQSSRVACVVNFFGPEDFFTLIPQPGWGQPVGAVGALFGGSLNDKAALARAASPVTHVSPDDPAFFTAHGTKDPLVPYAQAIQIDAALKKVGVPSLVMEMAGAGHGFRSAELDRRIAQFFDLRLRGVESEIAVTPISAAAGD
jgi:acetyl esterase/lipase